MTIREHVFAEFGEFKKTWDSWDDDRVFWRTGNALHACLECAITAKAIWKTDPQTDRLIGEVWTMLHQARDTFFRGCPPPEGKPPLPNPPFNAYCWRDDFGWWGIALLCAYENFAVFGKDGGEGESAGGPEDPITAGWCLSLAHKCWDYMWQEAWDRGGGLPVSGGCWNDKDGGCQNTVTNVLFLTLSIRLYSATKNLPGWGDQAKDYLEAACEQYRWFGEWFIKGPNRANDIGIYDFAAPPNPAVPPAYWLLERPINGPNDDYNKKNKKGELLAPPYETANGFADNRKQYWSGDQGLFLAGLIGIAEERDAVSQNAAIKELDKELQNSGTAKSAVIYALYLINALVEGVLDRLFAKNAPHVLHEAPMSYAAQINFPTDYAVGKGVLVRYLAFADKRIRALGLRSFSGDSIVASAQSVILCGPGAANKYGFIWDNRTDNNLTFAGTNENGFTADDDDAWYFSTRTARLDALVAAAHWNG